MSASNVVHTPEVITRSTLQPLRVKYVGIYARVSTRSPSQLRSLAAQVSSLTQFVSRRSEWHLFDIYLDFSSGKNQEERPGFQRMLEAAQAGVLQVVITKSITRFGRNTIENIQAMRDLVSWGCTIYFQMENLSSDDSQSEFIGTLYSALAQAENESRIEDIKWGIKKRLEDGTSKLYTKPCYGYERDENGTLCINYDEANVVRRIYDRYLRGSSVYGIKKYLESKGILSPKGNKAWPVRTIDLILSNEKYAGTLAVFRTVTVNPSERDLLSGKTKRERYCIAQAVEAIIDQEQFKAVQEEKKRRCNYEDTPDGRKRKTTRYSSKKGFLPTAGPNLS